MRRRRTADTDGGDTGVRKVLLVALAGNLAIALTKFIAWMFTGSTAMLTEGIHSVVDTADQLLLLAGQNRAAKAATENHPFGYGMETYFWTFIVALMIFLAGGLAAIWQGVERLVQPEPVTRPLVNFVVLAVSAAFEGLSFRTAYREFRNTVRGRDVRLFSFLRASKDPNVFATLLEDGAALAGLAIATLGVTGAAVLGWSWADGAASILIGLLLVAVALFLANETRSLIAGEAAAPPIVERLNEALGGLRRLGEPARMRTLHLGPRSILVAICWRFPDDPPLHQLKAAFDEIQAAIRATDLRICDVLFETPGPAATREAISSASSGSSEADIARPDPPARLPGSRG
jgi:cation diffusion facilitator family transporter